MHQGLVRGNADHSFSQLETLKTLDASDTDMGNAELEQLQGLSQLRSLNLTWTKVTRPPLVSSLTSLELGNVEVWCFPSALSVSREADVVSRASRKLSGSCWVHPPDLATGAWWICTWGPLNLLLYDLASGCIRHAISSVVAGSAHVR